MQTDKPIIVPVPWLSQAVIDFINQYLNKTPSPRILEFGSGCSTAFFATHAPTHLVSIEHNPKWFELVQDYLVQHNLQIDLRLVTSNYHEECAKFPANYFDFVLIDAQNRMACLQAIKDYDIVKKGGIVMLDDSDMYKKYQVADQVMQGWPQFELSGLKQNPLNLAEAPKVGAAKWWVK